LGELKVGGKKKDCGQMVIHMVAERKKGVLKEDWGPPKGVKKFVTMERAGAFSSTVLLSRRGV